VGIELLGWFWPSGVFGVRRVRGEVTEGLAVVQPCLFGLLGRVGVIDGGVFVCFLKLGISLATKTF